MSHETFFDAQKVRLSSQATMELLPDMTPLAADQLFPYRDAPENHKASSKANDYERRDQAHQLGSEWPLTSYDMPEMAFEGAINPLDTDVDEDDLDIEIDDDDDDDDDDLFLDDDDLLDDDDDIADDDDDKQHPTDGIA